MTNIPTTHPRYASLMTREKIAQGVEAGITSLHGLIAQGRGEAWDYLLGERTNDFAARAIEAAAAMLLLAEYPVISVNGNVAALTPEDIIALANLRDMPLEINIFHASKEREALMQAHLLRHGAKRVLMPSPEYAIRFIDHNRRFVNPEGIFKADVVFVPLEDGDRCEALIKNGKRVITVDLNPLSRTARTATVTIVDNITRAVGVLIETMRAFRQTARPELAQIVAGYDNQAMLRNAQDAIRANLASSKV